MTFKHIKKLALAALFAAMVSSTIAATAFAVYFAVSVPAPGTWKFGSGLGQATHVRISGAYPVGGTVTLQWVKSDKTVTNTAWLNATCTNGAWEADTNGPWFVAGDYILRGGTVTNVSECTVIFTGGQ